MIRNLYEKLRRVFRCKVLDLHDVDFEFVLLSDHKINIEYRCWCGLVRLDPKSKLIKSKK